MGKVIIADILKASADNSAIESQSLLGYRQEYALEEIGDEQFVPKRLINFDVGPQYALIPIWQTDTEYLEDQAVKKLIDSVYYIFVSNADANTTEPIMGGDDWDLIGVTKQNVYLDIPAGSSVPYNIDMLADYPQFGADPKFIIQQKITDTKYRDIFDCIIDRNYNDDTLTQLNSIDFTGHSDFGDPALTIDDIRLIIYI
ncbi:MAG TPA: hypothetical protein VHA52_04665 [Candidatus Babeliaceae bacterium]|nr:hypothetical protein [Candidatus Babeliaceae bacterium]